MIIDEDILIEKFNISEEKGYDYLIDNAETDEQIDKLIHLQDSAKRFLNDTQYNQYLKERCSLLIDMNVNVDIFIK